ncbi:MAG: flippase-like domain-containing protein [Actinobacteria bacterium]|nr:flippase-like domain-containing protein [Actinomycetota bacterium]
MSIEKMNNDKYENSSQVNNNHSGGSQINSSQTNNNMVNNNKEVSGQLGNNKPADAKAEKTNIAANGEQASRRARIKSIIFRTINVVIVVGLGIFLVYYLLTQVSFTDLKTAFLGVYKPSLVIGLILMFSIDFFKTYRQKLLIGTDQVRMVDMFLVSLIRNAFNMVLPARTGELSYVYVLKRKFKISVEVGVSTLMVGLLFEIIIVFCMIIISVIIVGINRYPISSTNVILIAAGLLAVSLILLFFLSKFIGLFIRLFNFFIKRFARLQKNRVIVYLYEKLVETNKNIEIIQGRRIYWKVYLASVATRVLKFTSYYFLIHATLAPMGYTFADLSYWVIFLATVAAEISAVLPTHAFAGLGTYEGAFALAFVALGFSKELSIIVGFNYHIINLIFTIGWGLIAVLILVMPFYKIRHVGKS